MYNRIQIQSIIDFELKTLEDLSHYRQLMEAHEMNPNYSQLARQLKVDRRTVKKYYEGYEKPKNRNKSSKVDPYLPLIQKLLSDDCLQRFHYIRHLWRYLVDNHELPVTESTFRHYLNQHPELKEYFVRQHGTSSRTILRFETEPGQQMQVDWKEHFKYVTRDGELIYINIFVAILSYSRFSIYHVTLNRKQNTVFVVLNDTFEQLGGVPKELLNDNLKTIMKEARTSYRAGIVNPKFESFSQDYGFKVRACMACRANTKGKVETQMKLLDEIAAYQGKFTFEELVEHVQKINRRKNLDIHPSTGESPMVLFEYEKDFLSPLPCQEIRSQYYYQQTVKVNASAMISYKSNQYSVPAEYIGQQLGLEVEDNQLYLYDNTTLIVNHPVSTHKLNYLPEHYQEASTLTMPYKSQAEIERFSKMNLERMSNVYDDHGQNQLPTTPRESGLPEASSD